MRGTHSLHIFYKGHKYVEIKLNIILWLQKAQCVLKILAVRLSESGPAGTGFCVNPVQVGTI